MTVSIMYYHEDDELRKAVYASLHAAGWIWCEDTPQVRTFLNQLLRHGYKVEKEVVSDDVDS